MLIAINRLSPIQIALLGCAAVTLVGSFSVFNSVLMYDNQLFNQGQWWRPLTAWIAQLNIKHWALNQWGVVVMAVLLPKRLHIPESLGFLVIWLLASVALSVSNYANYVGLSGILYGWLIYSAVLSPYYSRVIKFIFVLALSIKVFSENGLFPMLGGDWVGEFIGAEVAHLSHLWGLVSGYLVIVSLWIFRRFS